MTAASSQFVTCLTTPFLLSYQGYEAVRLVQEGLPVESVNLLKEKGLTFTEIAQIVIAPRTLKHRKARGERLTTEESERLVRVLRVVELAEKVFGDRSKALNWLRAPDERMENKTSLSVLGSEVGAQWITDQLGAIDEGMFT